MTNSVFTEHLHELRAMIEAALVEELAKVSWPGRLKSAVEYSLLAGGKRLRPVLVLLANEVCGGKQEDAIPAACAIEMVHTYSLIHDDLPSMDDDDFRRGRLTSHKVFGEALAILAGDCLLTLAFETIATSVTGAGTISGLQIAEQTRILASAAGGSGMVGGQVLDLEAEHEAFVNVKNAGMQLKNNGKHRCEAGVIAVQKGVNSADSAGVQGESSTLKPDFGPSDANRTAEKRVVELSQIPRLKSAVLNTGAVELGALHALAEDEDVLREELLVLGLRQVEVAAEGMGGLGDELVLADDRRDVLEHRLALVRVDAERGDHVEERVGVDVLLMRVAAEDELQLRRGDKLAHDVLDVVAHDAFGGGEVADAHADDPALDIADMRGVAPLLDVLAHRDVLRLPVVRLHFPIQLVGPLVFQREQIEGHGLATVDDLLRGKRGLSLLLVEVERLGADLEGFLHGKWGELGARSAMD